MSRIFPFSSPEHLVANSLEPHSYPQHYSASVESEEERTQIPWGWDQKDSITHRCSSFSVPHITVSLSVFFSIFLEGRQLQLLTVEKTISSDADEIPFKQNKYFLQHHLILRHLSLDC